jgi:thiamine-phosphate pyrophosphorylase
MHYNLPTFFLFIDAYEEEHIRKLDKKIAIIYRNYAVKHDKKLILKIKKTCRKDGRKFFLSNNLKLATNLSLDGVYLPSFNISLNIIKTNMKKGFKIIGSAHSIKQIRIKEKQGVEAIFISPLFKTKNYKKFLNPIKFNLLTLKTIQKIIALGGITTSNLNKLRVTKSCGFAGISFFKDNDKFKI